MIFVHRQGPSACLHPEGSERRRTFWVYVRILYEVSVGSASTVVRGRTTRRKRKYYPAVGACTLTHEIYTKKQNAPGSIFVSYW